MQVRGASVLAVAVLSVVPLAGCSSGAVAESPSPAGRSRSAVPVESPPPSQSPSPDPSAAAAAEVLRVYAIFMDARNKSLNDPRKPPDRRLFEVSIPPARNDLYNLVLYYRARHMRIRGATASHVEPPRFETQKTASIRDCVDGSDAVPVSTESGKSLIAPNQPPRLWVHSIAQLQRGRWVIQDWQVQRGHEC